MGSVERDYVADEISRIHAGYELMIYDIVISREKHREEFENNYRRINQTYPEPGEVAAQIKPFDDKIASLEAERIEKVRVAPEKYKKRAATRTPKASFAKRATQRLEAFRAWVDVRTRSTWWGVLLRPLQSLLARMRLYESDEEGGRLAIERILTNFHFDYAHYIPWAAVVVLLVALFWGASQLQVLPAAEIHGIDEQNELTELRLLSPITDTAHLMWWLDHRPGCVRLSAESVRERRAEVPWYTGRSVNISFAMLQSSLQAAYPRKDVAFCLPHFGVPIMGVYTNGRLVLEPRPTLVEPGEHTKTLPPEFDFITQFQEDMANKYKNAAWTKRPTLTIPFGAEVAYFDVYGTPHKTKLNWEQTAIYARCAQLCGRNEYWNI